MVSKRSRALVKIKPGGAVGKSVRRGALMIGVTERSIQIDGSRLEPPRDIYRAHLAWVEHSPGSMCLLFATRDRDDPKRLKTRLELAYPVECFLRHFWKNSREFHERLTKFAEPWPSDPKRNEMRPETMSSVKDHAQIVNFDSIAHSGTEASIDFFHLPPSAVARYARNQATSGLELVPIVQIQLTTFELLQLLDSCRPVAEAIAAYLPQDERGDQ